MATDDNTRSDEARVALNPVWPDDYAVDGELVDLPTLPSRPADNASKAKWVDYLVTLGADREAVTGSTLHWSDEENDYVSGPTYTTADLKDLADKLGG